MRVAPLLSCIVYLKLNSMYRLDAETNLFRHLDDAEPLHNCWALNSGHEAIFE
jgi:hypothetical protein